MSLLCPDCKKLEAENEKQRAILEQYAKVVEKLEAEIKTMKEEENRYGNLAMDVLKLNEEIAELKSQWESFKFFLSIDNDSYEDREFLNVPLGTIRKKVYELEKEKVKTG